jgi:hypothetical protein
MMCIMTAKDSPRTLRRRADGGGATCTTVRQTRQGKIKLNRQKAQRLYSRLQNRFRPLLLPTMESHNLPYAKTSPYLLSPSL